MKQKGNKEKNGLKKFISKKKRISSGMIIDSKIDNDSAQEELLKQIREEGQVADKNMKDSEAAHKGYSGTSNIVFM